MKIFHCDHCQQLVFFENVECLKCKHALAYLPDQADMASLEPAGADRWRTRLPGTGDLTYRLCQNYTPENICNWTVAADDPNPYCLSCRLTRVIPNLGVPGHKQAWYRLEVAKRRMLQTLLGLGLPVQSRSDDPQHGVAFEFLADTHQAVLTGHNNGVITVNVAEADDVEREKRRLQMHEPYRTLLSHFRHEIGHYYWDLLIQRGGRIAEFRAKFGDERASYPEALRHHYERGPAPDWQEHFVSAYAGAHPWEDWAESWAHYLHMVDTLETAAASGLSLFPRRSDEPCLKPAVALPAGRPEAFDRMIENWHAVTFVLNNLNRGMGLADAYPFVLTAPVIDKLRFVHETIVPSAALKPRTRPAQIPPSD